MTVESVTYISDLNVTYPANTDAKSEGDDHIRNLKTGIKNTFPNVSGAVTSTHTELNYVDVTTAGTAEASKALILDSSKGISGITSLTSATINASTSLQIGGVSVTSTAAELNYCDVTTAGAAQASKAVILDASKNITGLGTVTTDGNVRTGNAATASASLKIGNRGHSAGTNGAELYFEQDSTYSNWVLAQNFLSSDTLILCKAASGGVSYSDAVMSFSGSGTGGTTYIYGLLDLAASTAGKIKFPATQNSSTDANTLDDYEEGTWTPTVSGSSTAGSGTYTTQVGRYHKIGSRVFINGTVFWTAHTGTGDLKVNIPFTVKNVTSYYPAAAMWSQNIALTAGNVIHGYATYNSTQITIEQYPTGGGASAAVPMDTAGDIIFSINFETTA